MAQGVGASGCGDVSEKKELGSVKSWILVAEICFPPKLRRTPDLWILALTPTMGSQDPGFHCAPFLRCLVGLLRPGARPQRAPHRVSLRPRPGDAHRRHGRHRGGGALRHFGQGAREGRRWGSEL